VNNAGGGDIYAAAFSNGQASAPPEKLVKSFEHANMNASWVPATNQLLYLSRRGAVVTSDQATLILKDMRTGDEKEFARPVMHPILSWPAASPDARYAVTKVLGVNVHEIRLIDLQTRTVTLIARNGYEGWTSLGNSVVWARDGRSVYYTGRMKGRPVLIQYNVVNKTSSEVTGFDTSIAPLAMVLSPAGDSLACLGFDAGKAIISIAPLSGGKRREITSTASTPQGAQRAGIAFTPDGSRIVFGIGSPQALKMPTEDLVEVMSVSVSGGTAEPAGVKMNQVRGLAFAPDGRLTFTAGMMITTEIWRLDNLVTRLPR
jgi:Tol biopolymer transport system component